MTCRFHVSARLRFTNRRYCSIIKLLRSRSSVSAICSTVFSTTLDSLASWAFSSRSSLLSARICRFSSQRSALMPCNSRLRAWLPSCTVGCSSSPSAAWLRWVTRADCCFSSSARFTASAHASRQSSNCSGLFQRAHSGFCRPNFAVFGCFEQRSHPGSRAACVGVSHADTPAALLYLYCFSCDVCVPAGLS